jgi:hypothetical protein
VDLGKSFRNAPGSGIGLRASGYVLMAVLFFAVYWVAAGPGLYAFLSLRKLATLNWFLYGVVAVAAALLATLVVRVLQSGTPRLEHVTILRVPAGENAMIKSRIGLYVPSDGIKTLELTKSAPHTTNWITPFPEHPKHRGEESQYLAMKQYTVPILDAASDETVRVDIPWRSTMKRIEARWTGEFEGRIDAQTAYGKTALGVARRAAGAGLPCIAVGGGVDVAGIRALADVGTVVVPVVEAPATVEEAMAAGTGPLERCAERLARLLSIGQLSEGRGS